VIYVTLKGVVLLPQREDNGSMNTKWISPTDDGCCPKCGVLVEECSGVEVFGGSYYEPPEYGCATEFDNRWKDAETVILKHETDDGEICSVGEENTDEYCHACDEYANPEDYYEYDAEPDYDPRDPPDWILKV